VTHEYELVDIFTRLFPTERWEKNTTDSKLLAPTQSDVRNVFKIINFQPKKKCKHQGLQEMAPVVLFDNTDESCDEEYTPFMTDEYSAFNESFHLSSPEVAMKILNFFSKLVQIEDPLLIRHASVTTSCFEFSAKTLEKLFKHTSAYNVGDQSVIELKLLELISQCFNNLLMCDEKPIELEFKRLFNLLRKSQSAVMVCGLMLCAVNALEQCCIMELPGKQENVNEFAQHKHMVQEKIEFLKVDPDYVFIVQKRLIKIICAIKKINRPQSTKKQKSKRSQNDSSPSHHHSPNDMCIFERLLIDSLLHVTKYKHLVSTVAYLRHNGVCCCNGDIETISFMKSSTIPCYYFSFLERRVIRVMFDNNCCTNCNQKLKSSEFQSEYFELLNSELVRRQGHELHLLLHHLAEIHRIMSTDFHKQIITSVVIPTFVREKKMYLSDPGSKLTSRLIAHNMLQILCDSAKNYSSIAEEVLTKEIINHLKDCTLVPRMSANACMVLRYGLEGDNVEITQQIKAILFANIHYLIAEITEIYDQVGLPKSILSDSNMKTKTETSDFEVLDEQVVAVKESLSNMDVLLLNTIHWIILDDLVMTQPSFQSDFVANICNNFNENVLFTIAHHALNTILLKKESSCVGKEPKKFVKNEPEETTNFYERCEFAKAIIIAGYDINFDLIISRSYKLFEICQKFSDKLCVGTEGDEPNSFIMIYSTRRDKRATFKIATIHRDNFLTDNVDEHLIKMMNAGLEEQNENLSSFHHLGSWLHTFKTGIGMLESKNIREAFVKIVNRFFRADEELKAIYRINTIREITGNYGLKYLSYIARNCFDLCLRLSDNSKFSEYSYIVQVCKMQ
jgi:hypothetical protein